MLGVCYYPEHWPESMWQQDAREMKTLGLTYVRLAEFAWSKIEPFEGQFHCKILKLSCVHQRQRRQSGLSISTPISCRWILTLAQREDSALDAITISAARIIIASLCVLPR